MRHLQYICMRIADLVKVKTIVTLAVVFTLCIKTLQGLEISSEFIMIATAVITYYFCRDNAIAERMKEHEQQFHKKDIY